MAIDFTKPAIELTYFVHVELYDRDAGTTLDLYMGSTEATTKVPDGTMRHWMGRLSGGKAREADPQLYQSTWKHPTWTCAVTTADDSSTSFWETYLDPDIVWRGRPATVYVCDLAAGETQTEYAGTVTAGPDKLRKGESFRLTVTGNHPDVYLKNPRFSMPTANETGFIMSRQRDDYPGSPAARVTLGANVTAAATTWTLAGVANGTSAGAAAWTTGRLICIGTRAGNDLEVVRLTSNYGAGPTVTVTRGYAGTTAVAHTSADNISLHLPIPEPSLTPSGYADTVLPYVFGQQAANRGPVLPVWPQATDLFDAGGDFLTYYTTGIGHAVSAIWMLNAGAMTEEAAAINTCNDLDDGLSENNLGHADFPDLWADIDHPLPFGSYFNHDYIDAPWVQDADRLWARTTGITQDETKTGNAHECPCGIANYLATNTDWGASLTSPFFAGLITGAAAGTWYDEYGAGTRFDEITGIVPAFGATEAPKLADALQELCWSNGSDLFVRDGQWYPKKRTVESTSDFTVEARDLQHEFPEMEIRSKDYANVLTFEHSQSVLSEPDEGATLDPVDVPFAVTVVDHTEVTVNDGNRIDEKVSTKWWRWRLAATWIQGSTASDYMEHLEWLEEAAQDHLDRAAQPQIHLRTKLTHRHWNCYQGMTIEYDVDGYTTRKGQVRARTKDYDAGTIEIVSWHIEF